MLLAMYNVSQTFNKEYLNMRYYMYSQNCNATVIIHVFLCFFTFCFKLAQMLDCSIAITVEEKKNMNAASNVQCITNF